MELLVGTRLDLFLCFLSISAQALAELIWAGLERLKAMRARGCCLVGHPEYYGKVGFIHPSGFYYEGVPGELFFAISFDEQYPQGAVAFPEGFMAQSSPSS